MREVLINFLKGLVAVFTIVLLHFSLTLLLSYPFSTVNIIFSSLVVILLIKESGTVVWLSFLAHFILELYAVTSFGITLISGTLAILFSFWVYKYIFTNKTWYTAGALSIISLFIYRTLFSLLLFVQTALYNEDIIWGNILGLFGLELALTSLITVILFLILSSILPSLQKEKVRTSWFKILSSD